MWTKTVLDSAVCL